MHWISRALVFLVAISGASDEPTAFRVATKRAGDQVEITNQKDETVFAIRSPHGIGRATIERAGDAWPKRVTICLHLKGMEHFQVAGGVQTLEASIAQRDGKLVARLWKAGDENSPIDKCSPFWMEIRARDAKGADATEIPLKDAYFEMTLPAELLNDQPPAIELRWIDFYRG